MDKNKLNYLEQSLKMVGKKFDLLIIDCLARHKNKSSFNKILADISSINPRILSMRLKSLEQDKLITKSLILGTPVRTEYTLTQKAKKTTPYHFRVKRMDKMTI